MCQQPLQKKYYNHISEKGFILFLLICNFTFWSKEVLAKDYSITKADIKINLLADGSAIFSETRTYNFEGSFSWADQWIHLAPKCKNCVNYQITDISLRDESKIYKQDQSEDPGTFYYKTGKDFYIKWHYLGVNTSKTFTLTYTIKNAITNHADISEFYWQVIGDQWSKGTNKVNITVYLPNVIAGNQIYAYGHGPLNGKVSIPDNSKVEFSVTNLPAKQFLEVRILFPKLIQARYAQNGTLTLQEILNEEKEQAQLNIHTLIR